LGPPDEEQVLGTEEKADAVSPATCIGTELATSLLLFSPPIFTSANLTEPQR
jgi:hypothetical protein